MNNKIIGFTISPFEIDHSQVDIFKTGIKTLKKTHNNYFIYFWGIGDLKKCLLPSGKWSLSFPLHDSLEDRNVIISLNENSIEIENDWLGSIPIYYNSKERTISTNINFLIKNKNVIDFHNEGLENYLEFGFSILEQTPIKEIKFLRYYSSLIAKSDGLEMLNKKDIVEEYIGSAMTVDILMDNIQAYMSDIENKIDGQIIIPTSGGYDSRLLNALITKKNKINSFTYGISRKQEDSSEVIKAEEISKILKTKWKFIPLGNFNNYYKEWYHLYGPAMQLHGLYHIEFYKKIYSQIKFPATWLSGIMGDAWSGKFDIPSINEPDDLIKIGYVHGISVPKKYCLITSNNNIKEKFINDNQSWLKNPQYRIITAMRFKIILLGYLMSLPDYFNWPSWTPMLSLKHALGMLNLPEKQREDRKWQVDFFKKNNIYIEEKIHDLNQENFLNAVGLSNYAIPEINRETLKKTINNEFIKKLNNKYKKLIIDPLALPWRNVLLKKRYIGEILRRLGVKDKDYIKPYNQLIILKSLELLLNRDE